MELKAISQCGRICHAILGLVMLIFAAVSFSATWWIMYFWDCVGDDQYYYLVLEEGYCFATEDGTDDFDDCTSWEDIADEDLGDASDDAQLYIDANGLCKAGLAFVVIAFVLMCARFVPAVEKIQPLRYVIVALCGLSALLFVAAIGSASDNYYTDQENYAGYDLCSNYANSAYVGYFSAIVVLILAISTAMSVLFPCCSCIDHNPPASESQKAIPNLVIVSRFN